MQWWEVKLLLMISKQASHQCGIELVASSSGEQANRDEQRKFGRPGECSDFPNALKFESTQAS